MFGSIGGAFFRLISSTSSHCRPWQVAAAVAVGVACGILPAVSVLSCVLIAGTFLLPIHLPLVLVTAMLVALASPWMEPVLGQVGIWTLGNESVIATLRNLHRIPLVPWLSLNNTVTCGGIVVGVTQLVPTFLAMLPVARGLRSYDLNGEFAGEAVYLGDNEYRQELIPSVSYLAIDFESPCENEVGDEVSLDEVSIDLEPPNLAPAVAAAVPRRTDESPVARVESFLAGCSSDDVDDLPARDVAARASELAALVDEMLSAFEEEENEANEGYDESQASQSKSPSQAKPTGRREWRTDAAHQKSLEKSLDTASGSDEFGAEPALRRYLKPANDRVDHSARPPSKAPALDSPPEMLAIEDLMSNEQSMLEVWGENSATRIGSGVPSSQLRKTHLPHPIFQTAMNDLSHLQPRTQPVSQHEEALRYLLQHLKDVKKKV